jgi:hypothetical protein
VTDQASKSLASIDKSFAEHVTRLMEKGRSWELNWSEQAADAWRAVESRLASIDEGKAQPPASIAEMLCAARLTGPSPIPGLDLEHVALRDWSRVVLDRMSTRKLQIEPWLLEFALRRLGADNLPAGATERLLTTIDPELGHRTRARALPRRGPAGAQLAIVMRTTRISLTNGWAQRPTLGMVLVVEAKDAASVIDPVLQALPQTPVLLAWEETSDAPNVQKKVLEQFVKPDDKRVRTIYLYASDVQGMKSPAVVDPRGPDALFRQHRASTSGSR